MNPKTLFLAALLLVPVAGRSQDLTYRVNVEAGDVARSSAPASVRIPIESISTDVVKLAGGMRPMLMSTGASVKPVPAQIEFASKPDGGVEAIVVHWIEPPLQAGQTREYILTLENARKAGSRKEEPKSESKKEPAKEEKGKTKGKAKQDSAAEKASAKGQDSATTLPAAGTFRHTEEPGHRDLFFESIPVYRHMNQYEAATAAKPFHHIYGFHNDGFITKGPGGIYPHQRGVFLGWNKTTAGGKTYDFWKCDSASQRHKGYVAERETDGPVFARSASVTDWIDPSGKAIVRDTREVTAWAVSPGAQTVLDFAITLEALEGDVKLDGDAHHAGFQLRAGDEVAQMAAETKYVMPEGAKVQRTKGSAKAPAKESGKKAEEDGDDDIDEKHAGIVGNAEWAAAIFKTKSHAYGVMLMEHPGNPHTGSLVVRSYGRIGSFFDAHLKKGTPLVVRYRLVVYDADKYESRQSKDYVDIYTNFKTPLKTTAIRVGGK